MSKHYDAGNGLKINVGKHNIDKMIKDMMLLADVEVLVGFPEGTTNRETEAGAAGVTNATLGYVHDNGQPEQNIPARPFMEPGIKAAQDSITDKLTKTLKGVSQNKGPDFIEQSMTQVGLIAKLSIQNTITAGLAPPLSPRTIASRYKSRQTKSRRTNELEYMHLQGGGIDEAFLQGSLGILPLVNTGQLRNAVNYVIRSRRKRRK